MKKKLTLLLTCLFCVVSMVTAQTQKVTGVVISEEDGLPIVGASVLVKGTTIGSVTDLDGQFTLLNVPTTAKHLVVSYIGMQTQEVAISPMMKIVLKNDAEILDEVVVVAFGTAKKSAFTGSAAVVNTEALSKRATTNVADALVGSVAGLQMRGGSGQPGSGSGSINIRGIASLYANTNPLIIVDGAPYSSSLSNIPQGDIESISVLKDAASAALYGARGAAGVIIVTTKKGKLQKSTINVDMKWGSNARAVQDYDVITDPGTYYEAYYNQLYNYQFHGQGQDAAYSNSWANKTMLTHLGYNVYTTPDGEQMIGLNGKLNPNATLGREYINSYNGEKYYMRPDDWTKMAYKNALRQEYNISINGGTERSSFYASLGYLKEDGIIEYSNYDRVSARIKSDLQVTKWLKIGANAAYVHTDQDSNPNMDKSYSANNLMYYTSMIAPIYPVFVRVVDGNGNVVIKTDQFGNQAYDYGVAATNYGVPRAFLQTGNPLGANKYNEVTRGGDQLNGSFTADVNITKNLKFNAVSTVIWGQTIDSNYMNPFYGPKVGVNGELTKASISNIRTNNVQNLTYFQDFGKNSITAMIGHEYYKTTEKYLSATAQGGFSPDIKEINAFAKKVDSRSYKNQYNVEGYFVSAQYNYADKYYGSASYRLDASSRFHKDHRWGNFWSVGGAWIMSREKFMSSFDNWLDMLKFKLSVGQQGNDNIGNYAYTDMYSLSIASDTSMSPSFWRMGNSDITWETTTNINVGLEFNLFQNRLTGNIDFYTKKTSDLLFWISIPESAGSRGYYGNIGDIRNVGVELALTGTLIRTKLVDWSISANLSHNKTKILKLPESKIRLNGGFYESSYWYEEGQPMYNYMNYAYAGVNDQGEALYYYDEDLQDGDLNVISKPGKKKSGTTTEIGKASRYANGSILPKVYGGFSTSVRIGDFDASATFDYQIGGKVYDSRYAALMTPCVNSKDAGSTFHKDWTKSWTPENKGSEIPRWQYGDKYTSTSSDRFLTKASYLNFQSFTVGYTLPKNWIKDIAKVRIYAIGENLAFWSARKGLDPRYSYAGNESISVYSPVRNISGGIQVTF